MCVAPAKQGRVSTGRTGLPRTGTLGKAPGGEDLPRVGSVTHEGTHATHRTHMSQGTRRTNRPRSPLHDV